MNLTQRITVIISITIFTVFGLARGPEQIVQELQVEQAIHTKAEMALAKLLNPSEFVIIVNATMSEKPLSITSSEENYESTSSSFIPGMPTIPKQNIAAPSDNGIISYPTDKYLLYYLEIAIYLEENKASGKMIQDITRLLKEAIPDIADCDDCIRIETMQLGGETNQTYQELLDKIEEVEKERRAAEEQITNWKMDQLQTQLATSEDSRIEWENQARNRERKREIEDSIRLAKYIKIENDYRRKQDSLILVTSNKLDAAISGRIESESNITQELLDIIKAEMETDSADPSVPAENLEVDQAGTEEGNKDNNLILYILIALMIILLAVVLIVVLRKKDRPVYLKPINTTNSDEKTTVNQTTKSTPTAHQNDDVARSELNSLRQSAVSMSIGQKEGATQIVKDWLDSEEVEENENSDNGDSEE